jgi:hypothetical protein
LTSKFVKIAERILPPFLFDFMLFGFGVAKDLAHPDLMNLIKKNCVLKNNGSGKRAFLLATGPSIKSQDLSLLKGEDCFTSSNVFLHEFINEINPKFHFFAPYHKPLILSNYLAWMNQADRMLPKSTKIFLATESEALVKKHNLFKHREIFYLNFGHDFSRTTVDITKTIMAPQSVPLMVLPVLIYMGYSEIYLVGCDHTVLRDFKRNVTHFYNSKKDLRKNSSDKNTWGDIIKTHETSMQVFVQYKFYKDILLNSQNKIKIINLSNDSWLDLFDFKKFSSILKNKN